MSGVIRSNFYLSPITGNIIFRVSNVYFPAKVFLLCNNEHIAFNHSEIMVEGWRSCLAQTGASVFLLNQIVKRDSVFYLIYIYSYWQIINKCFMHFDDTLKITLNILCRT